MNTTDFLSIATAICPERDGIVFEGNRCTYAQLSGDFQRGRVVVATVGKETDCHAVDFLALFRALRPCHGGTQIIQTNVRSEITLK